MKPQPKTVPPNYKFRDTIQSIHGFTFKERLKFLLRFNLRVVTTLISEHSAGKTQARTVVALTEDLATVKRPLVVDHR